MIKLMNGKRIAALLLTMGLLTGCGGGIPIVSEVRTNQGYTDEQTMIIIATEKNRYQELYTDQIWTVSVDKEGTTFRTYLLEEVRSFLTELKTMNLLAEEKGISLSSQEKERLNQLANTYYASLTTEDLKYMGVTEEDVYTMYHEYHLANKLVDDLTRDVNLEISDSEAKVIDIQEIKVSDETRAQELYAQVTVEGADFTSIARGGTEADVVEAKVGKSERKKEYEDVVFQLQPGQISPVFQADGAYYIVKCISDYDEAATMERKKQLSLYRKNQAFRQIYDEYAAEHKIEVRGDIWETVSFSADDKSTTTSFFELYQEQMKS